MEFSEEDSIQSEESIPEVVEEDIPEVVEEIEDEPLDNHLERGDNNGDDEDDLESMSSITATTYSEETVLHEEALPQQERLPKDEVNESNSKPDTRETRIERPATSTGSGRDRKSNSVATRTGVIQASKPTRCDSASRLEIRTSRRPKKEELKRLLQSTDILSRPKAALNLAKTLDRFSRWGITTPTHAAQSRVIKTELKKSPLFEDEAVKLNRSESISRRSKKRCKPRKAAASLAKVRPKLKPILTEPHIPTKKLSTKSEKKQFIEMLHKLIKTPEHANATVLSDEYDNDEDSYLSEDMRSVES